MTTVDPRVFRTYDIRALVPELVDETSEYFGKVGDPDAYQAPLEPDGVAEIGRGLARFLAEEGDTVAVGYDARISSPAWADALAQGLNAGGKNVLDIGMATTDMVYYISGKRHLPGVMITASHCTKELNGMKIVRSGAQIVGMGSGMETLRALTLNPGDAPAPRPGTTTKEPILEEFIAHLMQFITPSNVKPFRIVADPGNGAGGIVARALFRQMSQLAITEMFFDPDGRFPNHPANPFEPENIAPLSQRIRQEGADFGVAWDGDADRCFFVDERGTPIPGDFITTLVAGHFLKRAPGATIVYDLRASRAVRDTVAKLGGKPIAERVGHSFIKRTMRAENAVFGGEVSGHYYFRDHYYADNGFIPVLSLLEMLSASGKLLSELISDLGQYFVSGEINSTVGDRDAVIERIKTRYGDGQQDFRDGITVEYPDWHFNVRPSANDPVVRLNLEASSQSDMETKRDALLALIRE